MSEKWRNENWFTSSWNFAEEVRSSLHFSDHIKIHDVTLRDGEQQAGLIFDYKQKIALAEKLSEMGIHRIEAGMPAVSAQDRQVIVDLAKRSDIKSEIFAFARCMVDDVKRAADCGVKGVVIEIPCNEEMITKAYGWTMEALASMASLAVFPHRHDPGLHEVVSGSLEPADNSGHHGRAGPPHRPLSGQGREGPHPGQACRAAFP